MNKIIVIAVSILTLSACASIPTGAESSSELQGANVTGAAQVGTGEAGLGTVAYDKNTRAESCRRIRKTGSHQYITTCDDPDGGSQPVRYGGWNALGRYAMSGTVRPE